jgi:hypothetical protein
MEIYQCPACNSRITQADRAWDLALNSGKCPNCKVLILNFPVPLKTAEEYETQEADNRLIQRKEKDKTETKIRNFFFFIWCVALIVAVFTGQLLLVGKGGVAVISYRNEPILFAFVALIYTGVLIVCIRWLWKKYA